MPICAVCQKEPPEACFSNSCKIANDQHDLLRGLAQEFNQKQLYISQKGTYLNLCNICYRRYYEIDFKPGVSEQELFEGFSKEELANFCKQNGIKTNGKAKQLVKRIYIFLNGTEKEKEGIFIQKKSPVKKGKTDDEEEETTQKKSVRKRKYEEELDQLAAEHFNNGTPSRRKKSKFSSSKVAALNTSSIQQVIEALQDLKKRMDIQGKQVSLLKQQIEVLHSSHKLLEEQVKESEETLRLLQQESEIDGQLDLLL